MAKPQEKLEELAVQLKSLSEQMLREDAPSLSARRAKVLRNTLSDAYDQIRRLIAELDPIKHPGFVFEPSNPNIAGRIAALALVAQPRKPLESLESFYGSGVYALFYSGDFHAYGGIARKEHPIYVGKADPADPASKTVIEQGDRLAKRLSEHRKNIGKAQSTLKVKDFEYRALVVQTGYQTAAEDYLIELFKPIWNNETNVCFGLGKHGDDPKTRANLRSPWDTLHPGREWAHRDSEMKDSRPESKIISGIADHLQANPPFESIDDILHKFMDEMKSAI